MIFEKDYSVLAKLGRYATKYELHLQTYINFVMETYANAMPKIKSETLNRERT